MRWQFVIFFSVFFTIYGLVNFYILRRGYQALELYPKLRVYFVVWLVVSAIAYFIGRWLENYFLNTWTDIIVWYGAFWLGLVVYAFISLVAIDFIKSILLIINHDLSNFVSNYVQFKFIIGLIVSGLILFVLGLGYINASHPAIKQLNLYIDKIGQTQKKWNIVMVSDVHLGSIINKSRAADLVDGINRLQPDIVLLVGDTIDEDLGPVKKQDLGNVLKNIKSVHGVYAVTGNHEYIGGVESAVKYLEDHSIILLQDQSLDLGDIVLVGRKDKMAEAMKDTKRLSLIDLLADVDTNKAIVLMDHEPASIIEVSQDARVDLELSGHTHNGQMWPFNFITKAIYEISWGYKKINKTQFYVSSGWGTWGPPIRTGNSPELVNLIINLK